MQKKQKHIHIEKIKLLYLHSLIPAVLSGVAALFLVAALWKSANQQHLMMWLAITLFLSCLRVMIITKFQHENPQDDAVLKWEKPFSISLLIVFLSWSIGPIWIMPKDSVTAVFVTNTFSVGLATAAISWYSPLRYLQMSSFSLALIPMIILLLTFGSDETFWVGVAASCMYVSCMITSVLLQKTFNYNLELACDLEVAKKEAEKEAQKAEKEAKEQQKDLEKAKKEAEKEKEALAKELKASEKARKEADKERKKIEKEREKLTDARNKVADLKKDVLKNKEKLDNEKTKFEKDKKKGKLSPNDELKRQEKLDDIRKKSIELQNKLEKATIKLDKIK